MITLKAKKREKADKQNKDLREAGILPAVLYGEGVKSAPIEVLEKEFEQVYASEGESSLIKLKVENEKLKMNEYDVLIHQISRDPLTGRFLHIDFYRPSTKKKVEAEVPLVFEGESLAVKDLGGILVRELQNINVKGLAHNLPRDVLVNLEKLKTFEDRIYIKDINLPEGVEAIRDENEIVALVVPQKEEEEPEAEAVEPSEEGKAEGALTGAEGEQKPEQGAEKTDK